MKKEGFIKLKLTLRETTEPEESAYEKKKNITKIQ